MKNYKLIIPSIIIFYLFIILGPDFFLKSGFFYNLDSVFYPVYQFKGFFSSTLFWYFHNLLQFSFGYELYSKIYFLSTLLVGVFLGYKITKFCSKKFQIQDIYLQSILSIFGIIFAISNPFIYERLMSQVGIALGVFCIGIGFVYVLEYLENTDKNLNKKLYISSFFFALSFSIFPHASIFILLIGIITFIFFWKRFTFKNIFTSLSIFLLFNANWLIGNFLINEGEKYTVSNTISTLNMTNVEAFTQNSLSNLGVEMTTLFGYGFWGEKYGHVFSPNQLFILWWVAAMILFLIIIIGFYTYYKKDKKQALYFGSLYIIFYILALGISSPLFSWFNIFLYNNVPYYLGMREPGKFLGMLAVFNSLFFIIGLYVIFDYLQKTRNIDLHSFYNTFLIGVILFTLLNAYNPGMLFAFKGQLKIVNYPEEYFQSKVILEKRREYKNVIFPWHSYMKCAWGNDRVFSNTYPKILNFSDTIQADNIEMDTVYTNYDNPVSKKVEKFLKEKDIKILQGLGVKNIIFQDVCADPEEYEFLEELYGVEKIFDREFLKIYHIENEKK